MLKVTRLRARSKGVILLTVQVLVVYALYVFPKTQTVSKITPLECARSRVTFNILCTSLGNVS